MPQIQAFRGLRYDLGHVGSLSDVVAPPYDVIDDALRDQLYERHPANVIRLILNRDEPGDDANSNRYTRAARFLKNWRSEGLLMQEADPALYVYHQVFEYEGRPRTRRGFMCRTRLERFGEGSIYPHEETHASAKEDRLKLTRACRTNLSQIFGLYPDPENEAQDLLEAHIRDKTPLEAVDHLGVIHRIWPVTDINVIGDVAAVMDSKPTFIADGHHRYETACNYRDELSQHGSVAGRPSGQLRADDVRRHERPRHDRAADASPVPRRAADRLRRTQVASSATASTATCSAKGRTWPATIWDQIEREEEQGQIGFLLRQRRPLGRRPDHRHRTSADAASRGRSQRRLAGPGCRASCTGWSSKTCSASRTCPNPTTCTWSTRSSSA